MRYVVLGGFREIEEWRVTNGVSKRDLIGVTPQIGGRAVRGVSGPFEVVTLPSWQRASVRVQSDVADNIAIAGLTRAEVA